MDGIEVCRRLRTFSDCYVVMLTARAEPFSPRELVARVHLMLGRPGQGSAS